MSLPTRSQLLGQDIVLSIWILELIQNYASNHKQGQKANIVQVGLAHFLLNIILLKISTLEFCNNFAKLIIQVYYTSTRSVKCVSINSAEI